MERSKKKKGQRGNLYNDRRDREKMNRKLARSRTLALIHSRINKTKDEELCIVVLMDSMTKLYNDTSIYRRRRGLTMKKKSS